jgi:hypothetical protein
MRIADPSRELKSRRQGQGRVVDNEDESEEDVQSNSRESRLILKLICKHGMCRARSSSTIQNSRRTFDVIGVIKTHSLNLGASPFLVATVDPATLTNLFVVPARTLRDWLDHFAASGSTTAKAGTEATGNVNRQESELGWYFHPEQIRVRTWESGSAARRAISTELKIGVTEFDDYDVAEIVCLTFPLREFRVSEILFMCRYQMLLVLMCTVLQAAITLADSWGIPLRTDFSTAGQPISLKLVTEHSIAELTIATTENEAFKDLMDETVSSSKKPVKNEIAKPQRDSAGNQTNRPTGRTPAKKKSSLQFSRETAPNFPQVQADEHHGDEQAEIGNGNEENEPLFYPSGSQDVPRALSQAQLMHAASQRELEDMGEDELAGIWEADEDLGLEGNGDAGVVTEHDGDERPHKIQRVQGNAEELLGKSLLHMDYDMNEEEEEEAPMTAYQVEEGDNTVSAPYLP